jgi:hypothetical protein
MTRNHAVQMNAMLARRALEAVLGLLDDIEGLELEQPAPARLKAAAALCRDALAAPPPGALTARQLNVLSLAVELIDITGRPPSLAELAREMGLASRSGAHTLIAQLRAEGWLIAAPLNAKSAVWPTPAGLAVARQHMGKIAAEGDATALELTESGRAALGLIGATAGEGAGA